MGVSGGPKIITDGLVLDVDASNYKSFRGPVTTNLIPSPTINAFPTVGNSWGTYNTNQYNNNTYFSIGTISSVTSNIVTTSGNHPLRSYDVVTPQTTGGGVTAGNYYLVKKISNTQFSLHEYNSSQDGSQGYVNPSTGNYKVYDAFTNDTRVSINSTSFPTMWWGPPHLPNSGLVKEIISNGFTDVIPGINSSCIRLHYHRTDDVKDGMSYNVDCTVTPGASTTISFYTRSPDERSVGKVIQYYNYNYTGGSASGYSGNFTLGPVGVWQRQTFTHVFTYGTIISYWFALSEGVYSWDWACMQVETGSAATPFVPGTRGATVATGGGWGDLSGNSNNGELVNGPSFNSVNGGGIVFDGIDDYINCGTGIQLTNNFTLEVWHRNINTGYIIDQGDIGQDPTGCVEYTNRGLSLTFNNGESVTATGTFADTTRWNHVACTFNSGTVNFYINGIFDSTKTTTTTTFSPSGILKIGRRAFNTASIMSGTIGLIRIYNRVLSLNEVLQNFNATRSRFGI